MLVVKGAVFIFVLHNRMKASEAPVGSAPRATIARRAAAWIRDGREGTCAPCVRFAAIEIATRLSDVTCVTEPRALRPTPNRCSVHPFCVLLENARAGRGGPSAAAPRAAANLSEARSLVAH